jgi:hypothetical protein
MAEPFDARVSTVPPRRSAVVAPERNVLTGRYGRASDRDAKHRQPDEPPSTRPRRAPRPRRLRDLRRVRPWQLAAGGVAVVAAGGGVLLFAGDGGGESAPTTNPIAAAEAPVAGDPGAATGGPATAVGVPTTAAAVLATAAPVPASAAVTAPPVTSTLVTSTTLSVTDEANGLAGQYEFTMTITDGNSNFPVGTRQNVAVTLLADCPGPSCSVSSPAYPGATWSFDGTNLATSLSVSEPCPNGQGQATTTINVALRVTGRDADGRATSLTGTQNQATPDVSGCENATNDPITWTIVATRAD